MPATKFRLIALSSLYLPNLASNTRQGFDHHAQAQKQLLYITQPVSFLSFLAGNDPVAFNNDVSGLQQSLPYLIDGNVLFNNNRKTGLIHSYPDLTK